MMDKFKPYPDYKDSGLPWLGDIPAHWEVRRNSRLFTQRNETGYPDLPILEVSLKTGVRVRNLDNSKRKQIMSDREKYKRAAKGDIAYNMMRMWQGAVGVAPVDGLVSPAYVVASPHPEADSRYYSYLFRTDAYKNEVNKWSRGIVSDRNRLYWDEFKNIPTPHPPIEEQTLISDFLDINSKHTRIFIEKKLKVIKLLTEQKNAIINRATTKGIHLNIEYKETDFAWLGHIPKHWDVIKLKRIAKFSPSKSETPFSKQSIENVVFLPMERITVDGQIDCSERRTVSEVWDGFTYFRKHDVVIAKITPCFENGKGAYLGELETDYGFGTTELIVIRSTCLVEPRFLYLLVNTPVFRRECTEVMVGAAGQKRVPVEFVKNFVVGLPPLEEQREILSYINIESSKIDMAINRTQREIELIQEYHTCMINNLVTGKLDVREIVTLTSTDAFHDSGNFELFEELTDTESVIDEDLIDEEE